MEEKEKDKTIGDYKIEKQIGAGSVGATFAVLDPLLGCRLAVKCLRPPLDESAAAKESVARHKERFAREVQAMVKLDHPSIVRIYDYDLRTDNPYYVMEYCDGGSLEQVLQKRAMSPTAVLRTIWPICSALACAHSQGVLHRDIKPGNILFGSDGRPRISDFGMCRIADWHTFTCGDDSMLGTLYYLPPEQGQDPASVDPRSDIYSLGRTLRHMLVGSAIGRSRPSSAAPLRRRKSQLKKWDSIVARLTALERSRRPRTMRDVAVMLDRVSGNLPLGGYAREMRHTLLGGEPEQHQKPLAISADEFARVVAIAGLRGFGDMEMRHMMGHFEILPAHRELLAKYGRAMSEMGGDGPLAALVLLSACGGERAYRPSKSRLLEAQRVALRIIGPDGVRHIRYMPAWRRSHR